MKISNRILQIFLVLFLLSCNGSERVGIDIHLMSEAIGIAETKKIAEAEQLLIPILEKKPNWGEGWMYLGRSLAVQGQYDEGASAMEKAGKLGERKSTVWLEACSMANNGKNKERALSYFSKALVNGVHRKWLIQNSSYDGFLDLDSLIYLPKAKELLIKASKKRASLHPDLVYIEKQLFNLDYGLIDLKAKDVDSLLKSYFSVVETLSEDGELYFNKGKLKIRQGDFEGALKAFENAKRLNYLNVACDGWLAYIHSQLGNTDKAFDYLEINLSSHDTPNWVFYPGEFEPLYQDPRWKSLKHKYSVNSSNESKTRKNGPSKVSYPTNEWHKTTPAQVGLNNKLLKEAENAIQTSLPNVTSLLVVKNGQLAFEKYFHGYLKNDAFNIKSATKSITGILAGIMYDKHILPKVNTPLYEITPQLFEEVKDSLKFEITLEHLLTMTTGIEYTENNAASLALYQSGNYASIGLRQRQAHDPGDEFSYSSVDSHILATALTEVCDTDLLSFAQVNLFDPLGVQPEAWAQDLNGVYLGDSELRLRPRDLAKIGLLILREGKWDGKSIISKEWIDRSTTIHVEEAGGPQKAYGYQFWIRNIGGNKVILATGYGGQLCAIVPSLDLVCIITSEPLSPDIDPDLILGTWIIPAAINPTKN